MKAIERIRLPGSQEAFEHAEDARNIYK